MRIHSISDVTMLLKGIVDKNNLLRGILVRGEISNFKKYPGSGHCYFTLKDENASLKCVMFKSWARFLRFSPQNGMKVIAAGDISIYERDGIYQLYVNNLQPDGVGDLAFAYEQLKNKLESEGLFLAENKKALPRFPKTIGIVTSESGAVLHDIYTVTKRRATGVKLVLYPVAVQGEGAAQQIAHAIGFFNKNYPVDVLIVGRGGGSAEDLWAFNEEKTVRAVAGSRIPVISAVGHETDFSLTDFAADMRAATPSQAAELAVPDMKGIKARLEELSFRLNAGGKRQINNNRVRIAAMQEKLCIQLTPQKLLAGHKLLLDKLTGKLHEAATRAHAKKKQYLELQLKRLELLNPVSILRRGYTILQKDNAIIDNSKILKVNDEVKIIMCDGIVNALITRVEVTEKDGKKK